MVEQFKANNALQRKLAGYGCPQIMLNFTTNHWRGLVGMYTLQKFQLHDSKPVYKQARAGHFIFWQKNLGAWMVGKKVGSKKNAMYVRDTADTPWEVEVRTCCSAE